MARTCAAAVVVLLLIGSRGIAGTCSDTGKVTAARAAVESVCPCVSATGHNAYVRCARKATADLVRQGDLPRDCQRAVLGCISGSTCGRATAVTCCRTTRAGVTRCSIKRKAASCSAPRGGTACVGSFPSCCDACTTGGCAVPPCASATAPACGGSCPSGQVCASDPLAGDACGCFPDGTQACGDSRSPLCNGTCPSGERCGLESVLGGCFCVPEGVTACGEVGLGCGLGYCAPGDECGIVNIPGLTYCACAPVGLPCCQGGTTCPTGTSCFNAPGICGCF